MKNSFEKRSSMQTKFGRLWILLAAIVTLSVASIAYFSLYEAEIPVRAEENSEEVSGFDIDRYTLKKYTGNATVITIPVQIKTIAAGAFKNNTKLVSVLLNANTEVIEQNAFYGCTNIKNITIPDGSKLRKIGYMAFARCGTLREISLPEGLTEIGGFAFFASSQLTKLTLPESLRTIGEYAFMSCVKINSFSIGKNVTSIGRGAFNYCISLISIGVDGSNSKYASTGGVLYSKDFKTLYRYPAGKRATTYSVHNSTNTIATMAFWDNRYLKELTLSSATRNWHAGAINDRSENAILTKIKAPNESELKKNEYSAIKHCPNLTVVYG